MNIQETIILGVVSGILTSAFIFLCVNIFNKIIIPWYRATIYSGIDISGLWEEIVDYGGAKDHTKLELSQKDCNINGLKTIIKTDKETEKTESKVLLVEGRFQDGHLLLTMTNKDKRLLSLSTYLLRVSKGGSSLIGQSNWVDVNTGKIHTRNATFNRLEV